MEVVSINGEDMSGSSIVLCVHRYNKFSAQTIKYFETFYFENEKDINLWLAFDSCDKCRVKGYEIFKRFGQLLYSGLNFRDAMKARM